MTGDFENKKIVAFQLKYFSIQNLLFICKKKVVCSWMIISDICLNRLET